MNVFAYVTLVNLVASGSQVTRRHIPRSSDQDVVVSSLIHVVASARLKQAPPPAWGIQRTGTVVQWGVNVVEKVPDVSNDDTHDLILGNSAVKDKAEAHQHPREVRGGKDEQTQKAESGIGIPPGPDVYERG